MIASGIFISYLNWVRTGEKWQGHHSDLMEAGEGRTRFLGIVGMAFGLMFLLITITDTITLALVPICAR